MPADESSAMLYPRVAVERRLSAASSARILSRDGSAVSIESHMRRDQARSPQMKRGSSKMSGSTSSETFTAFKRIAEKAAMFEDLDEEEHVYKKRLSRRFEVGDAIGEEKIVELVNNPNMRGILQFTSANTAKLAARNGVNPRVLRSVVVEDEMLMQSCIAMPIKMIGIAIFMFFFQQHYLTSYVFLQEMNIREAAMDKAYQATNIDGIYHWLEHQLLPFLWSTDRSFQNSHSRSPRGAHYDFLGGLLLRIQRSRNEPCKDSTVRHYMCNSPSSVNSSGAFLSKDDVLAYGNGWYRQQGRRLKGVETSNLMEDVLAFLTRLFPGTNSLKKVGHWDDERAAIHDGSPTMQREQSNQRSRLQGLQNGRTCSQNRCSRARLRRTHRHLKGWHPARVARRLIDPVGDYSKVRRPSEPERNLRNYRPEYDGWIPQPNVQNDVWEYIVPMSTPEEDVKQLFRAWRRNQIIDRSTLFFGVEALLRNDAIANGLASHVVINFLFSRGGNIYVDVRLTSLVLNDKAWVIGLAIVWVIGRVANTIFTPARACRAYRRKKLPGLRSHLLRFHNWIEWLLTSHAWLVIIFFVIERWGVGTFNTDCETYKEERKSILPEDLPNFDVEWFKKLHPVVYFTGNVDSWLLQIAATYHLFLVVRFIVATRGQKRLAVVIRTVRLALYDLIHLAIVLWVVFLAYVFSGHLLFGTRDQRFSTLKGSLGVCVRIVFEREFDFKMMTSEDYITSSLWVFSFVIASCLVLVNITLAIVIVMYEEYRAYLQKSDTIAATINRVYMQVCSSCWVSNAELVGVILKIAEIARTDDCRISVQDLKKQLPRMCQEQVHWLYTKSAEKVNVLAHTSTKDVLHLAVAQLLVFVLQLQRSVRLMARNRVLARTKTQPLPFGFSRTGTTELSTLPACEVSERRFHSDEDGEPFWLKDAVIPFFHQQLGHFEEMQKKLEIVAERLQSVGFLEVDGDVNDNEMPCTRPDHPKDSSSMSCTSQEHRSPSDLPSYEIYAPVLEQAPRATTSRAQLLIDNMPRSNAAKNPGSQLEEARARGQVLQDLSAGINASVLKERPVMVDL